MISFVLSVSPVTPVHVLAVIKRMTSFPFSLGHLCRLFLLDMLNILWLFLFLCEMVKGDRFGGGTHGERFIETDNLLFLIVLEANKRKLFHVH